MWPFHRKPKWIPKPGDQVRFEFEEWKPIGPGMVTYEGRVDVGEVVQATVDGKHVQVKCKDPAPYRKGWWQYWVHRRNVQLLQAACPTGVPVDARVLEEVVLLRRAIGSAEALIELLRSVREPCEVGKEEAS